MSKVRGEPDQRTYRHTGKDELTERQLDVLHAIADGITDAHIARTRYVAESTVRRHVRDVLSKLGARNRAHAVHIAHQKGILK